MLLAIVRHAKAEKTSITGRDEDRPLAARGVEQAEYLAERFGAYAPRPGAIVSSPALRTRETAQRIARRCGVDFDFDERLRVGARVSGAVEVVVERAARRDAEFVVIVGHNDQVSELVNWLASARGGQGEAVGAHDLRTGQAVLLVPRGVAGNGAEGDPGAEDQWGVGRWGVVDTWRLARSDD